MAALILVLFSLLKICLASDPVILEHICDISRPCGLHGNCLKTPHGYNCQCDPGYSGTHCDYQIAVPSPTRASTVLPSSSVIQQHICDISRPCGPHGQCIKESSHDYRCQCKPGFEGRNCDRKPCQCVHGSCRFSGPYRYCSCEWPYIGSYCEKHICSVVNCLNGASCVVEDHHRVKCICKPGFTGDRCETQHICLARPPCQNGGTCVKTSDTGFRCNCPLAFYGDVCEHKKPHICDVHSPCQNGGTCVKTSDTEFTCNCQHGSFGKQCEFKVPPVLPPPPPKYLRKQPNNRVTRDVQMDEDSKEMQRTCDQNKLTAKKVFSDESFTESKWKTLHPAIKTVLMDLIANDDHRRSSSAHAQIKKAVAGNDLMKMSKIMAERRLWMRVPVARYWKRKQIMKKAVENPWSSVVESKSMC